MARLWQWRTARHTDYRAVEVYAVKRYIFQVQVQPADTSKAAAILKGSVGVNTLAAFAGWCRAGVCGSGTEIVRHFVIESSYPATGALSVSVTVDGVLASPQYTTDAEAAQAMQMLASLMQGALERGGVTATVTYASQDYNGNYSTMDPVSDAVTRLPQSFADVGDQARQIALDVLQYAQKGIVPALFVVVMGSILFLTVAKAVTE